METIRIPNAATYAPISLTDIMMAAPLASRLLIGATLPGRILQTAAFGLYAGSVVTDWARRIGVRKVDFQETYGADISQLAEMPEEERLRDIRRFSDELSRIYEPYGGRPDELAVRVNERLTTYIAGITGQRVETSSAVRRSTLARVFVPFAVGSCDVLSGDIAVFKRTGVFEPHILAHEFCHRKGYFKEIEAQMLGYLALAESSDPVLRQAALAERVFRNIRALDGDDPDRYAELLASTSVSGGLLEDFRRLAPSKTRGPVSDALRRAYDMRMKMTGQNGLSDYDRGFTNLLYAYRSHRAGKESPAEE